MNDITSGPSARDDVMILAGEIATFGELLPFVDVKHLPHVRQILRSKGRWQGATPRARELIALALDACCQRMVDAGTGDAAYFVGVGDMLAAAPDDASGAES